MADTSIPTNHLPFVSVIIPTFNREQVLCDTIDHMLAQDYPHFEVIIVDQTEKHEPATQTYLEAKSKEGKVRYLFVTPPNLCHARNVGIKAARGPIILFVDDDIVPSQGLIRRHAETHISAPDIGGVAGGVSLSDGAQVLDLVNNPRALSDCQAKPSGSRRSAAYAIGCNMSYGKDVLLAVGLFDPGFGGIAFMEEADLSVRIRKNLGLDIIYQPEASVVHLRSASGGARTWVKGGLSGYPFSVDYWQSVSRFYIKHHGAFRGAARVICNQLHFFRLRSWIGKTSLRLYPVRWGVFALAGFLCAWQTLRSERATA